MAKFMSHKGVATMLRGVVRRADNFGHSREDLLEALIGLAEAAEAAQEVYEMQDIIDTQKEKME